jgi:hypothetical protein
MHIEAPKVQSNPTLVCEWKEGLNGSTKCQKPDWIQSFHTCLNSIGLGKIPYLST